MKRKPKPKFTVANTHEFQVVADGVTVNLTVDREGRLVSVGTGGWDDNDAEHDRRVALAVDKAARQVQRAREKLVIAAANAASAEARDASKHWLDDWLAKAYAEHPEYGRERLAVLARKLAAAAGVEPDKRDEITADRTRRFLDRQPSLRKSGA